MVFIPVSNMPAASRWYSRLFALPLEQPTHDGRIYGVPMQGEVGLLLDAHPLVTPAAQPVCFFWTDDIQMTEAFLRAEGILVIQSAVDIGSVFTITIQDPDGHRLVACQKKAPTAAA